MASKFLEVAAVDAIASFVNAKQSGAGDQEAGEAARAKLKGALLQAFVEQEALKKWKPLAMPLADLAADGEGLELPLVAPDANHVAKAGDWTWSLKANASMSFLADVLDAGQLSTLGIPARESHQIVRYALRGELGAAASGGASAGVWSLNTGASASAKAAMEWYIAAANHNRLGQALIDALPFMAPPMSLTSQLERAGDFEYWGSTTQLDGAVSASFSAGAAVSHTGWTWGFDGDKAKLVFSMGVSGSAKFQLAGQFRLRCIVKEAGTAPGGAKRFGIEVTLERARSNATSLALSISAGVDARALAKSADRWLRGQLPEPDKLDKALELLTNPGSALGDRLRAALEKTFADSKLKDLVLLAAGFGDPKTLAKSLAERAAEPLMDEIDKLTGASDDMLADAASLADRWLQRAFGGLPIPAQARTQLENLVKDQLTQAKANLDDALTKLADKLESKTSAAASELLKPFATLGEQIQEELQGIASKISASQASEAVRKGLAEYARRRKLVLGVLSDAQRAKIGLTLAGSLEQTHRSQTFFRATFVTAADMAAAERLFQALWSGRLDQLVPLLADARESGAIFGEPDGWLLLASKRVSTLSLNINLLGFSITNKVTKVSDLQLQADLAGNVLATGKSTVHSDVQNYWTERHARLALTATSQGKAGQASVEFAFNGAYSARGRDIDPDLFNAMQRTLVRVAGGSGEIDIRSLLGGPDGGSMDDKAFRRNVAFLLPMSLQPDEFGVFLDADAAALQASVVRFGLRALDAELEELWDPVPSRFLTELALEAGGNFPDPTARLVAYLQRFPFSWRRNASDMPSSSYENLGLDASLMKSGSPLHRKLGTMFRLAQLTRAIVELKNQCRLLRDLMLSANSINLAETEKAAFKRMGKVTDALANFSVASQTLIGSDEMVSWPFATFAACMAQSVGRPVPPGFIACAVLPGKEATPVPLIAV